MKKNYIYNGLKAFGLFLAVSSLTACFDKLDELPDNRTEIDSPEKVGLLLVSAYPEESQALLCELSGDNYIDDNVVVPATHNDARSKWHEEAYKWQDINNYSMGEQDTPNQVWETYYAGVSVCNHAIQAMLSMSKDPAHDKELAHSWGEAHVLRAYLHFVLVNTFAEAYKDETMSAADRGIPYVTKPETQVHVDYSGSDYLHNVKETYDLIEKDLLEGINLIDDSKYKVPAYHFTTNAANAFAARFYLYKRDYDKCIYYADRALGTNPSSMLRKWATINTNTMDTRLKFYNDHKAPCSFLIQTTYSVQDRMLGACRYAINDGKEFTDSQGRKWTVPSTLKILIDGGGPNWSGTLPAFNGNLFIYGGQEYGVWLFRVYEYFEYTDKIAGIGYVHMLYQPLTADETLLCRAEAKLYKGDREGAIQDLGYWTSSHVVTNELTLDGIKRKYNRSDKNQFVSDLHPAEMGFKKVLTGDDLSVLDCILHFRRIETMFEGLRWFDIKRYGITVYHHYRGANEDEIHTDSLTYNDSRRVLQVPNNVIEAGYPANRTTGAMGGSGGSGYQRNLMHAPENQPLLYQSK